MEGDAASICHLHTNTFVECCFPFLCADVLRKDWNRIKRRILHTPHEEWGMLELTWICSFRPELLFIKHPTESHPSISHLACHVWFRYCGETSSPPVVPDIWIPAECQLVLCLCVCVCGSTQNQLVALFSIFLPFPSWLWCDQLLYRSITTVSPLVTVSDVALLWTHQTPPNQHHCHHHSVTYFMLIYVGMENICNGRPVNDCF